MLTRTAAAAVVIAAVVAAGAAAATQSGTLVTLHSTPLGKVLATSKGFTLYLYTPDPKGKSTCTGACAAVWPPLLTVGKPRAGMGVHQSLLGTVRLRSGKLEVTYNGHALHRYSGDTKAGQTKGEGIGGVWYAISAAGKKILPKTSTTSTTGTTTTYRSGY